MANISNLGSSFAVSFSNPTLVVTTGTGANFPAAPFYVTATPAGSLSTMGTSEILLVTAKSGDTFTVTRAQKGTSTKSIAAGWIITNGIYVEDLMSTITFGEVPTGTVNGTNTVFTTAQPFTSIEVFKNGLRLKGAGNDYTVTNNTTITFTTAPTAGTLLLVNYVMGNQTYLVGSNSLVTDETPSGSVNGVNTTFTTAQPYIGGSLQVFVNGVKQKRVTHFVETTPSTGSFTISDAPQTGDDVMVVYQFVQSTTANADTVDGIHANTVPTPNQLLALNSRGQSGEWWEELARTTLTSAGNSTISVTSIPTKKYMKVLVFTQGVGTITQVMRFNNDSGSNYTRRYAQNGAADVSDVSQTSISLTSGDTNNPTLAEFFILNISSIEKIVYGSLVIGNTGAGNAINKLEYGAKWVNTSSNINRIDIINSNTGTYAVGSEVIVLGHD